MNDFSVYLIVFSFCIDVKNKCSVKNRFFVIFENVYVCNVFGVVLRIVLLINFFNILSSVDVKKCRKKNMNSFW